MESDSYLRKSTADAGKSTARQERDWRTDCAINGLAPGRAFIDPDLSASRYARKPRPDYGELVAHIRTGDCEMLAMWEASRGSRTMSEWVALLDLCRDHGVLIRIFGGSPETFDPRRPRDREALLHEGIASERESETIADRSRAGARDLAFSGKPPGPLLYGYTRKYTERGRFRSQNIQPEHAVIIRQLATDTLAGRSLNSQAAALNQAGVPVPSRHGQWTGHGIARMLQNPGYIGKRIHNGEVVADAVWPAILTEEQHGALITLLRTPGRRVHMDSTLAHELSGAARCGVCERVLRTHTSQGLHRYDCVWSGCGAVAASSAAMNRVVGDMIRDRLRKPGAAEIFAPPTDTGALLAARNDLAGLRAHLAEFIELAGQRKLSAASLATIEARINPQIAAAERRLRKLSVPSALAAYADIDVAEFWYDLEPAVRREFVIALAEVVLSPCGKGGRWSIWRLAESRWVDDQRTWGDLWRAGLLVDEC